ncbi:MAG: nucleotidyltransferase family protein [Candidatus Acidiferrales bacterium]
MSSHQGHLWPTAEQELLLRACLLRDEQGLKAYREWAQRVDVEALDYGSFRMLPLLYRNLQRLGLEATALEKFKGTYRQTHYQNKLAFHRVAALLGLLARAGIDTLVLKGAALIPLYYGEAGVRPMADFDLVVGPEQALDAIQLLERSGWEREPGLPLTPGFISVHYSWHFRLPAAAELDLHWYVFDQCCYPRADAEFWKSAVPLEIEGFAARTLNPTDHLLHTCVHGAEWSPVPPLRWVADAMTIFGRAAGQIDWQRLVRQAKERRLVPAIRDTLTYLQTTLDAPVPNAVLSDLRHAPVGLIERVEYRSRTSPPGNFPSLRKICFGYLRHRARAPVKGSSRLLAFPRYLQARWGASSLWQIPVTGARLVKAAVADSFSRQEHAAKATVTPPAMRPTAI